MPPIPSINPRPKGPGCTSYLPAAGTGPALGEEGGSCSAGVEVARAVAAARAGGSARGASDEVGGVAVGRREEAEEVVGGEGGAYGDVS